MGNDRVRADRPGGRKGTAYGDQTQAGSGRSTPKRPKQNQEGRKSRSSLPRRASVRELAADRDRPRLVEPFAEAAPESLRGPHPADRFLPLREDHVKVEQELEELRSGVYADEERVARWTVIATALETHAQAEEEKIYPHLAVLGRNDELLEQHQQIRLLIGRIDGKQGDDEEYRALLDELAAVIRQHVELEEQLVLPIAEQRLDAGEVDRMVAAFIRRERQIQPGIEERRIHPGPRGDRTGRSNSRVRHPRD